MKKVCLRQLGLFSSLALLMLVSCNNQSNANFPAESSPAERSGHLLSPEQVTKLTKLPIPIVAPTDVPKGFRVTSADGASAKLVNGDDDTGYSISYEREDGTCFAIASSQDGPRRLKQIGQVESAVGLIKMYEETYEDRRSVQSFIPVRGNPVMISPFLKLNSKTGNHAPCKPLTSSEYEQILKSIEIVK